MFRGRAPYILLPRGFRLSKGTVAFNSVIYIVTYRPVAEQRPRNGRVQPLPCNRPIKKRLGKHVPAETISRLLLGNCP
jgi:hypothetical protein